MTWVSQISCWNEIWFRIIIKHCLIVCLSCITWANVLHLCSWELSWNIQDIRWPNASELGNSRTSATLLALIFGWCGLLTCWKYIAPVNSIHFILTIHQIDVIFSLITASLPYSTLFFTLSILWIQPCISLEKFRCVVGFLRCCKCDCTIVSWRYLRCHPLLSIVVAKPLVVTHVPMLKLSVILCVLAFRWEISLLGSLRRCGSSCLGLSVGICALRLRASWLMIGLNDIHIFWLSVHWGFIINEHLLHVHWGLAAILRVVFTLLGAIFDVLVGCILTYFKEFLSLRVGLNQWPIHCINGTRHRHLRHRRVCSQSRSQWRVGFLDPSVTRCSILVVHWFASSVIINIGIAGDIGFKFLPSSLLWLNHTIRFGWHLKIERRWDIGRQHFGILTCFNCSVHLLWCPFVS